LNKLLALSHLNNRYFAMRHGHSLANQQGIIVSHPENGCDRFGLSELGQEQVKQSLAQNDDLDGRTIVLSSDFRRARESALIAHQMLDCGTDPGIESRLRERHFGELEMASDDRYREVWRQDASNPDSQPNGCESVNQVMDRVTGLVRYCEERYADETILLVSHGDALQILQTAFARFDGARHRQLQHLHTAEIRRLTLAVPTSG
jgi:probable phosphoglycerate mutase